MLGINVIKDGHRHPLELAANAALNWEWLSSLLHPISEDSFSLPTDIIPITPTNQRILGAPEVLELKREGEVYWEVEVIEDGLTIIPSGRMTLLSVEAAFDYRSGSYSCTIAGTASVLGAKVVGQRLNSLPLYPLITFTVPSREFAYQVMTTPTHEHRQALAFAPVHRPGFFDGSREDYDDEAMYANVANRIQLTTSTGQWYFAPPTAIPGTDHPAPAGVEQYSLHRTIPYFRLTFVLRALFRYFGYNVVGSFFSIPDIHSVFIDNNYAIEVYQFKTQDLNRSIDIRNHLPAISVAEFLSAVFEAFNLHMTFDANNTVRLDIKDIPTNVLNITDKVINSFTLEDFTDLQGFVNFAFDSSDQMVASLIKEDVQPRASFPNMAAAAAHTFSPALADGDIIYIESENLYYSWSVPYNKFVYYAEGQQGYRYGADDKKEVPLSPLLRWLEVSEAGNNTDMGMCSSSGLGSYVGFRAARIVNPFPLRLFMIRSRSLPGIAQPVPYSTNISDALSLSYSRPEIGLWQHCFRRFYAALTNAKVLKVQALMPQLELSSLHRTLLQIRNHTYLPFKVSRSIGLHGVSTMYLVKL